MPRQGPSENSLVDIFISYRRQGGATVAALLNNLLRQRGFQVFMDVESLQAGNYNLAIKQNIAAAKDFVLIVTEGVFDSEWVVTEITEALKLKKNIHPVFVNGLKTFPQPIPKAIGEIGELDGVILNESHFTENITKLQLRFSTKNQILLNKIIDQWHPSAATAQFLCQSLLEIFDEEEVSTEMIKYFGNFLRERWLKKGINHHAMINAIGEHLIDSLSDLKEIATELGIPAKGSKTRVLYNLGVWLDTDAATQQSLIKRFDVLNEDDDRYNILRDCVVDLFKSREELSNLKKIAERLCESGNFSIDNWRSSWDICWHIFDQADSVESLFELLNLTEPQIKKISKMTLGSDVGRKQELTKAIARWVEYWDIE